MDLDRQAIERSSFSTARRGYEPAEVDVHLREVAAAVEDLREELEERRRRETLSGQASERVRAILDAAEASAAAVRSEAEADARQIVEDARTEADELASAAERRRGEVKADLETVGSERRREIEGRADELGRRADGLESELEELLGQVRLAIGDVVRELRRDVDRLRTDAGELVGGSEGRARTAEGGRAAERDDDTRTLASGRVDEAEHTRVDDAEARESAIEPRDATEPAERDAGAAAVEDAGDGEPGEEPRPRDRADESGDAERDTEGPRLIALNMALSGSLREETAEYLRETFGLDDESLLDDVYRRVAAS